MPGNGGPLAVEVGDAAAGNSGDPRHCRFEDRVNIGLQIARRGNLRSRRGRKVAPHSGFERHGQENNAAWRKMFQYSEHDRFAARLACCHKPCLHQFNPGVFHVRLTSLSRRWPKGVRSPAQICEKECRFPFGLFLAFRRALRDETLLALGLFINRKAVKSRPLQPLRQPRARRFILPLRDTSQRRNVCCRATSC